MRTLIIFSAVLLVTSASSQQNCKPRHHFWRPYNGTIPRDAFVAATDEDGKRSYVAKIIPMDQYSWTVPAQLKGESSDHLDFSWCCKSSGSMRVDEFIEILCTDTPKNLSWKRVNRSATEISSQCCMVQGGAAWYGNQIYRAYIGRGLKDGQQFIGRLYEEHDWPGVHIMDGGTSSKILSNFEVLTYDCGIKNNHNSMK